MAGIPIFEARKKPERKDCYTNNLVCPYCPGTYVAPSRCALRSHVSRRHREEHRKNKEILDLVNTSSASAAIAEPIIKTETE